jgi:hypothetical protein
VKARLIAACVFLLTPISAEAADSCTATALVNIPEAPMGNSALKGEQISAVTQYTKSDGRWYYCSHGGGCYSAYVTVRGKAVKAIRLNNCTVDFKHPDSSDGDVIYYTQIDRSRTAPLAFRLDDIDNRLLELGLCNACAGTAAYEYVHRPKSPCANLTRQALEGNPVAIRRLLADENVCTATWSK